MKLFIFHLTLIVLTACNSGKKKSVISTSMIKNSDSLTIDKQPAKTIIDFITWYKVNMSRLNKIELVNNSFNTTFDSTKLYSVNFNNTEKYLSEIKKSTFVSDNYLEQMRDYFKKCDNELTKYPQYDGPPEGFDFDLILWSQEYDEDLANIEKSKISVIEMNDISANLKLIF